MLNRYLTFSDESHWGNHRYMVIGGLVCSPDVATTVRDLVRRARHPFPDVLKWERIRKSNFHRYARLVQRFMLLNQAHKVDFAAVVIDTQLSDHDKHNDGDSEMGFHKWVAQHLFRHSRLLGRPATFQCFYAERSSRRNFTEVQDALNNMAKKHYRDQLRRFIELKLRPFRDEEMFQMSDILIGAVGAAYNGTLSYGPKTALAELIRQEACLPTLAARTPADRRNFDIWEFQMER